jgi:UDP-N-acetylmuramate dehydrogenase
MNIETVSQSTVVQPSALGQQRDHWQPIDTDAEVRLITPALLRRLQTIGNLDVLTNVKLAAISRWKIGGIADCIVCPHTTTALQQTLVLARDMDIPVAVIGLTTNLLFAQQGIRALVVHLGRDFADLSITGNRVRAQAGVWVPRFARRVAQAGLAGIEHLAGIPGTLGGLVCMNGGTQRKGIGDHLVTVTALDLDGTLHTYNREQCGFSYRSSMFQHNRQIIIDAEFIYEPAPDKIDTRRRMKRILEDRRRKFPQKLPNCGSVFVSNPALYDSLGPPGAAIEKCGLKGSVHGGAEISPLHANFIVNTGGASAADVLYLIELIRSEVQRQTGHDMEAEAKYVDALGNILPAHDVARQFAAQGRVV